MIVMNGPIIEVPTTPVNCVGSMQFEDTFPAPLANYGITVVEYKESIAEFNKPIRAPTIVHEICWVSALAIIAGIGACIGGAVTSVQSATTGMAPGIKAGFILFACGMALQILFRCIWAQLAMPKLTEAIRLANERFAARNVSFKWLRQQTISHSGRRTTTRTLVLELGSPVGQQDGAYSVGLPHQHMMAGMPMMPGMHGNNGMLVAPGAIPDSAPPAYAIAIDDGVGHGNNNNNNNNNMNGHVSSVPAAAPAPHAVPLIPPPPSSIPPPSSLPRIHDAPPSASSLASVPIISPEKPSNFNFPSSSPPMQSTSSAPTSSATRGGTGGSGAVAHGPTCSSCRGVLADGAVFCHLCGAPQSTGSGAVVMLSPPTIGL